MTGNRRAPFLACLSVLAWTGSAVAQMPGGAPQDVSDAINNPHEYAWRLFLALNRQAHPTKRGEVDPAKPTIKDFDSDKPVVWETWAKASGGRAGGFIPPDAENTSEIYRPKGARPKDWDQLGPAEKSLELFRTKVLDAVLPATSTPVASVPLSRSGIEARSSLVPLIDVGLLSGSDEGQEVRMNRAGFDFVLQNTLYNVEGLEARLLQYRRARNDQERAAAVINFPLAAQEVKARWLRLNPNNPQHKNLDKTRYHWRTVGPDTYLLTGFHVVTKDLPNWFWSDFEHVDGLVTVNGDAAAERESVDPARAGAPHPSTTGTKWANYRLRGVQVDFTDTFGRPTILANTQIEKGFQQTSSCITCHSRATVGLRSEVAGFPLERPLSLPVFEAQLPILIGSTGRPQINWFFDDRLRAKFLQTDFLWSIPFRALSTGQ
jgi:hypothetical protein